MVMSLSGFNSNGITAISIICYRKTKHLPNYILFERLERYLLSDVGAEELSTHEGNLFSTNSNVHIRINSPFSRVQIMYHVNRVSHGGHSLEVFGVKNNLKV